MYTVYENENAIGNDIDGKEIVKAINPTCLSNNALLTFPTESCKYAEVVSIANQNSQTAKLPGDKLPNSDSVFWFMKLVHQ